MTMKDYEHEGFPIPARVRIAIGEKAVGNQVEIVAVDVPAECTNLKAWRERVAQRPSITA